MLFSFTFPPSIISSSAIFVCVGWGREGRGGEELGLLRKKKDITAQLLRTKVVCGGICLASNCLISKCFDKERDFIYSFFQAYDKERDFICS